MFNRTIYNQLSSWQHNPARKPLMLFGARQVGKTYALKTYAKTHFEHCAYFSLNEEKTLKDIFRSTNNPAQIIEQLSFLAPCPITPGKTLLILDEIQDCPEAIASLKYFCEDAPQYHVACAGSLLGLAFAHQGFSFPVGKVDHLSLHPLTFSEFLEQKDPALHRYYLTINTLQPIPDIFFSRLLQAFNAYRISGGMPEAASHMLNNDTPAVNNTLSNILRDYSLDFVKHATPTLANRITHVWNSLPSQLAKENRKFLYQLVRPGARAREYEDALLWLQNAGLIHKVPLCHTPQIPLKSYNDLSIFKIYALDIGLLRTLAQLPPDVYLTNTPAFKEFKGALAENYILQSLIAQGLTPPSYWTSGNQAEVEFLLQRNLDILPIEVKSGTSVTSRSLAEYSRRYNPPLRLRLSLLNLKHDNNLINIPLFLADRLPLLLPTKGG